MERTGLEMEDRICSIAVLYTDDNVLKFQYDLINDGKKMTVKASSINHITNEMIKNKPILTNSESYKLLELYNNVDTTLIGHNIQYDLLKLSEYGFHFKGSIIDTLRVSKHLIKECESYSLQFLRYELKLYQYEKEKLKVLGLEAPFLAHDALHDSLMVNLLYTELLKMSSYEEMCTLSFEKVLLEKFEFGKYKGRYIEEIVFNDRAYIEWMLSNIDLDDDLRYSIFYYIN